MKPIHFHTLTLLISCLLICYSPSMKGQSCSNIRDNSTECKCAESRSHWDARNNEGGKVSQGEVHDRIHEWGGAELGVSRSEFYHIGNSPLGFSFSCSDLETLTGYTTNPPSIDAAGIRVYFGLTKNPSSTETPFNYLGLFLVAVNGIGNDLKVNSLPVLAFNSSETSIPINNCLSLRDGKNYIKTGTQATNGFISMSAAAQCTTWFQEYVTGGVDRNWDNGVQCPLGDAKWFKGYTFCKEFFKHLLSQEGAEGIRFYFGTVRGKVHTVAMAAYDINGDDICGDDSDGIYYIDWAMPCPTLCDNDLTDINKKK